MSLGGGKIEYPCFSFLSCCYFQLLFTFVVVVCV